MEEDPLNSYSTIHEKAWESVEIALLLGTFSSVQIGFSQIVRKSNVKNNAKNHMTTIKGASTDYIT